MSLFLILPYITSNLNIKIVHTLLSGVSRANYIDIVCQGLNY